MGLRLLIVGMLSGLLLGVMDGLVHGNPLAVRLYAVYQPIARVSLNVVAGAIIDLAYGFIMASLFLVLYKSLPGESALLKGISFGLLVWFFRVVMYVASQWTMFEVPINTIAYELFAGLVEMAVLGTLYGLSLSSQVH